MSRPWSKYGCICFCLSIFILGLALFGFFIGAGRFLKVPDFQVVDFQLHGLDESLISYRLDTESAFIIETRNRGKKMHLYYDEFHFKIEWKDMNMGLGKVAGFDQGSKNTSYIHGSVRSSPAHVALDLGVQAQLMDARNNGNMTLSVYIGVRTQWKDISGLKSDEFDAEVLCTVDINPKIVEGSQLLNQDCLVQNFKCLAGC